MCYIVYTHYRHITNSLHISLVCLTIFHTLVSGISTGKVYFWLAAAERNNGQQGLYFSYETWHMANDYSRPEYSPVNFDVTASFRLFKRITLHGFFIYNQMVKNLAYCVNGVFRRWTLVLDSTPLTKRCQKGLLRGEIVATQNYMFCKNQWSLLNKQI